MSDPSDALEIRHAATEIHGRFVVRPPRTGPGGLWLVGFHGQAQTADEFAESLARIPGSERWLVASVQGLNRHYTGRTQRAVASWMTSQDRELAIADNVRWVDTALDAIEREFGPARTIVYAGFSQGVAMAYRAALLGQRKCEAIVAAGGDVPPELRSVRTRDWPTVLLATGARDPWFKPERLGEEITYIRTRRPDAQMLVFDGVHEWSDAVEEAAGGVMAEIEATTGG
jgi:predicted esterase